MNRNLVFTLLSMLTELNFFSSTFSIIEYISELFWVRDQLQLLVLVLTFSIVDINCWNHLIKCEYIQGEWRLRFPHKIYAKMLLNKNINMLSIVPIYKLICFWILLKQNQSKIVQINIKKVFKCKITVNNDNLYRSYWFQWWKSHGPQCKIGIGSWNHGIKLKKIVAHTMWASSIVVVGLLNVQRQPNASIHTQEKSKLKAIAKFTHHNHKVLSNIMLLLTLTFESMDFLWGARANILC